MIAEAKDSGARLASLKEKWFDLDSVERKRFGWFSKKILSNMGVEGKPAAGSICPVCNKPGDSFALDHMTPWRHYIAVFASQGLVKKKGGKLRIRGDAAKALYNDPENLWWICSTCNGRKTDIIPDSKEHAAGDLFRGTRGRSSSYRPGKIVGASVGKGSRYSPY